MDINFEYYKIFYYVAKYGNFTKAAGVMKNSQPNITRMINSLEHELQCTLFIRTNRGVKLTTEGEKLYNRVSAAMMQFRLAEEELSDHTGIEHGSIAIGVSEIALNLYLLEHLKKFHANYPGVRLKIWNHTTPQAIQAVKTGEVDLAVVTSPVRLENSLRQVCLQTFHEILVAGKTFQALKDQSHSIAILENYPWISMGKNTATHTFYQKIFYQNGLAIEPEIEAATADQILSLVESELGLAFLPEEMVKAGLKKGKIFHVPIKEEIPDRYISLVYDPKYPMSTAAYKFKKQLHSAS